MSTSSPTPDEIQDRFHAAATRLERLDTKRINWSATILVSLGWLGASCLLALIVSLVTGNGFLTLWVGLTLLGLLVPVIRVGYRAWAKVRYAHYANAMNTLRSQGQCVRPLTEEEQSQLEVWRRADTRARTHGAWTLEQDEALQDVLYSHPDTIFMGDFENLIERNLIDRQGDE